MNNPPTPGGTPIKPLTNFQKIPKMLSVYSTLITNRLTNLLIEDPGVDELLTLLSGLGDVAILGGALRDWIFDRPHRDIDVIVDAPLKGLRRALAAYRPKENAFQGFKLISGATSFDVWTLNTTWAFKSGKFGPPSFETVPKTTFLNIDGILYNPRYASLTEHGFTKGLSTMTLHINNPENPYPEACARRALKLANRYGMKLGDDVQEYITARGGYSNHEQAI